MDAATRAELDALRARAYGPAADIQADPGAIARLELLERIVHGAASASAGRSPPGTRAGDGNDPWAGEPATRPLDGGIGDASGDGVGVARDPGYPRDPGDPRDPGYPRDPGDPRDPGYQRDAGDEGVEPARRRRTGRTAVVGAAAVAALLMGGWAVSALRAAPDAEPAATAEQASYGLPEGAVVLLTLPMDGQFGSYGTPPEGEVPDFPVQGRLRWTDYLGDYYGSELWIGGIDRGTSDMLCIVLVHADATRGRCEPHGRWERGALFVPVPYASIDPAERPDGLGLGQSLGFWWAADRSVYIVRGAASLIEGTQAAASPHPARFRAPADSILLLRVPVGGSIDGDESMPAAGMPRVPALWEVRWARALGEFYGFGLWLGAAEVDGGDRLCIVVAGTGTAYVKSACGPREGWERGGLFVSVPYSQIDPDELPAGLASGERLGFWWTPDDSVRVLGGGSRPADAFG